MSDEEKAIDYAQTECCNSCTDSCKNNVCKMFCNVRNAVLYGFAEGKPKWHDLRENPDDLPEESGEYWCKLKEIRRYTFEVYYKDSLFYKSRWEELGIIAWTELPMFEEVENGK